jgi:hypothetical protein
MKKVIALLCVLVSLLLTSCYSAADLEEAYDQGYRDGYAALKPVERPASGAILAGRKGSSSEITVTADTSEDYVVALKDNRGTERVVFYVRAGTTVTVGVPAEELRIYFASGKEWYGYGMGLMFGDNTHYSKDDESIDFAQYTIEYTLYPVDNGNFSETPSNEEEFF